MLESLAAPAELDLAPQTLAREELDTAVDPGSPGQPVRSTSLPTLPGYDIVAELGRGGMGVVYKARQLSLNRWVAVKMIRPGAHTSPRHVARFHNEARAVARVQHPNVVQIHEVGEHDGQRFIAFEFVQGGTLAQKLAGQPLPPREAAALIQTLARAAHVVHQQGIIHRDLKPANVLLARGANSLACPAGEGKQGCLPHEHEPKITDFGLAKQLDDESQTESGAILGTACYMAPEQAWGKSKLRPVGPATDVYALGVILYEMLTGGVPFRGETALDTLEQVWSQEPVPPRRLRPKVPRDLETICLKCLRKDPGRRYATAEALADDLARFLDGRPIHARPVGLAARAWKWARRHPAQAVALAAVLLAVPMLLLWQQAELRRDRDRAEHQKRLRHEDATDYKVAVEHVAADRIPEAARVLARASKRLESEPVLKERQQAWDGLRRLVQFYEGAEEAWFRAGEERYDDGRRASERALAQLHMLDAAGRFTERWWERLPDVRLAAEGDSQDEVLCGQIRQRLRQEVYRQLLLLTYLRTVPTLPKLRDVWSIDRNRKMLTSAQVALHEARNLERAAPGLEAAETVRLYDLFLRDVITRLKGKALFPEDRVTPAGPVQPSNALDHFFSGTVHYFLARTTPGGAARQQVKASWGALLDMRTPLATAEDRLREATRLDPGQFWPHFMLGRTLLQGGRYAEARHAFTTCVVLRPDFPIGYQMRGLATVRHALALRADEVRCAGASVLGGAAGPLLPAAGCAAWPGDPLRPLGRSSKAAELVRQGLQDADEALRLAAKKGDTAIWWTRGEMFALLDRPREALRAYAVGLEKEQKLLEMVSRREVLTEVERYARQQAGVSATAADAQTVLALIRQTRARGLRGKG